MKNLYMKRPKNIFDCKNHFIILPEFKFWTKKKYKINGKKINRTFEYSSNTNKAWIKGNELGKKFFEKKIHLLKTKNN